MSDKDLPTVPSEETLECLNDWFVESRSLFWAYATGDPQGSPAGLGLTNAEVHVALGVASLYQFKGSKAQAFELLQAAAAIKTKLGFDMTVEAPAATHGEARVIAWADIYCPDGTMLNVTAREGATAAMIVANTLEHYHAVSVLKAMGFKVLPRLTARRAPQPPTLPPDPQPSPAPTPTSPSPAPAPTPKAAASAPTAPSQVTTPPANGPEMVRVPVATIIKMTTDGGHVHINVKGGKYSKHGVTAWPEKWPQLSEMIGLDVDADLAFGALHTVTQQIVAVCEVPAGKEWAQKVDHFEPGT